MPERLRTRVELGECILESHKKLMECVEKDMPCVTVRAKVLCADQKTVTVAVISTSTRIKIAKMLESKVFAKTAGGEIEGTIVDVFDDRIVIHFTRRLKEKTDSEISLKIHSNHNNEILYEAGVKFFDSEKFTHPMLLSSYCNVDKPLVNINSVDTGVDLFNDKSNQSQVQAVSCSLQDSPFRILGPPGTGKTETIVEIISQNLKKMKTVLVCGPSNISIDNIITRFIISPYNMQNPTSFYRLGSSFKGLVHFNLEKMALESVSFMEREDEDPNFEKEIAQRKHEFMANYRKKCPLVFSTLFSSLKESFFFDLCVVDEACQATQLECLMGVVKAKNFVLVGDPNQLCPASSSLYESLNLPTVVLNTQYRMHSDLLAFSNEYFYKGSVMSLGNDDFMFFGQSKILLIDTSYSNFNEETLDQSKMNLGEARIIQKVVEWLGIVDIGVIAPYSAQVKLLREMISVQVETVDGFQGQEKDFIVLSLVRSNDEQGIGFLKNEKRLNVAITRCRRGLVIVCDVQNFHKDKFFRQFFRFLEDKACVVDPETFDEMISVHVVI